VEVQAGRPHSGRLGCAEGRLVGGLLPQHDDRVADLDLGVHYPPARPGHAHDLLRGEPPLVEFDRLGPIADDQIRRDGLVAIGNRLHHDAPPPQSLSVSTSSRTAAADFWNAACSSAVSVISITCSTPFRPSFTGTPT